MSDELDVTRYRLNDNIYVVVREYLDHPAKLNTNIKRLFCADGWWRVECWTLSDPGLALFATIIMIRVFDEKWQNKSIALSDRLSLLCIPVEGYFHGVSVSEPGNAITVQFSPNEEAVLGYVGLKVPSIKSS